MVLDFFSVLINHIRVKWRDDKYSHVLTYVNATFCFILWHIYHQSFLLFSFYIKKKNQFQT